MEHVTVFKFGFRFLYVTVVSIIINIVIIVIIIYVGIHDLMSSGGLYCRKLGPGF